MHEISRRGFLAGAAAAAGAAALTRPFAPAAEKAKSAASAAAIKSGADLVTLGKSGIQSSVLGIGTGTVGGRQQRELGPAGFTKLLRHALDRGIRYIDTAYNYQMHPFVRLALQDVKGAQRDRLFIQTKTPATHPEVAKSDIERFRKELGVDRIDSLLMHCMRSREWPVEMLRVMDVLYEAKEKQLVRAVGVSCHGLDPILAAVDCDWIDIHLVRINPFGQKMEEDGKPDNVAAQMKKMREKGRGVIGMKVFGENGFDSAEKRLQSLRYVLGLGCVQAFTIGFVSTQQIDETLDLIEKAAA